MNATSPGAAPGGAVREAKAELRARMRRARGARGVERRREADAARTTILLDAIEPSICVACYLSTGDEPATFDLVDRLFTQGSRVLLPLLAGRHHPAWAWYRGRERLRPGLWGIPEPVGPGGGTDGGPGAGGFAVDAEAHWRLQRAGGGVAGSSGTDRLGGGDRLGGVTGGDRLGGVTGAGETVGITREVDEVPLSMADLVLCSGLAATRDGRRLGVGGGWYDRALGSARPGVPVWILLDDADIVDDLPSEPHDRRIDAIVTQSAIIATRRGKSASRGEDA